MGSTHAAPLELPPGFVLDGWLRVVRRIGTGGVGSVFEAEVLSGPERGQRLAVKVIHPEFARVDEVVARFRREAQSLAAVRSPHVVAIRAVGSADTPSGELPWIAMELVEGCTVADLVDVGPLAIRDLVEIGAEALEALGAVHDVGVYHRDVKPENLFLAYDRVQGAPRRRMKLIDFGLSRALAELPPNRLTRIGFTVGTPMYMAPEQALGDVRADHRIDLFSMGVTLFEMATGELPFDGPSYTVVLARVLQASPPPPRSLRPDLPPSIEAVILHALEKDPARRFADAYAFRAALLDAFAESQGATPAAAAM